MIWNRYAYNSDLNREDYKRIGKEIRNLHRNVGGAKLMPDHDKSAGAGCWDGMYWSRWFEYPMAILSTEPKKNMRVLDVGCGCSPFLLYLKTLGCECHGVDPCVGMKTSYEAFPPDIPALMNAFSGTVFKRSGMEEIPYPDNHFDRVYNISVIEHLLGTRWKVEEGIREMSRVLKEGGLLCVIIDARPKTELIMDLNDIVKEMGLKFHGNYDYTTPVESDHGYDDVWKLYGCYIIQAVWAK